MPSDAEPYSPEIAELAPLFNCGRVSEPTDVADVPPAPRANSSSMIGDAVSRPLFVAVQTWHVTVLMTRSPGVNNVVADAEPASNAPASAPAPDWRTRRGLSAANLTVRRTILPPFSARIATQRAGTLLAGQDGSVSFRLRKNYSAAALAIGDEGDG